MLNKETATGPDENADLSDQDAEAYEHTSQDKQIEPRTVKGLSDINQHKANERLKSISAGYRGLMTRVWKTERGLSRAEAMKAMCLECVGYSDAQNMVGNCPSELCPMHSFRPYQTKEQEA